MKGFPKFIFLVAAISLYLGVIWPAVVMAAPQVNYLEEIRGSLTGTGAIDVDAQGNLYVADQSGLVKFNNLGTEVAKNSAFTLTRVGLAYNPKDDRVYASAGNRVEIFDSALNHVGTLGAPGDFVEPGPIDVLPSTGEIFVADISANKVKIFDGANPTVATGEFSDQVAGCSTVYGLAVDPVSGFVYVSYTQGTIQAVAFDRTGVQQIALPATGSFGSLTIQSFKGFDFFPVSNQPGASYRGYFTDFTGGRVAVVDVSPTAGTAPVFAFDLLKSNFGDKPAGPWDVAFDPTTSRLFVTEAWGVAVFGIGTYSQPTNRAPSTPVPQSPVGGSSVGAQPTLSYQAATDLDGDPLTYGIEVVNVGTFSGIGGTSYQLNAALQENSCYDWRVKANDGTADSAWSALERFCVNAINEPPSVPVIQSLLDGGAAQGSAQLIWTGGVDADPGDLVNFKIELATDAQFASGLLSSTVAAGPVALQDLGCYTGLVPGVKYFWRVRAVDSAGAESLSVNTGSFLFGGTRLAISANMPGAKVYFDGNHAYAGQYVGEAPLELMDVSAGLYTVVVERAGFEPFVAPVRVVAGANVEIKADLLPAYEPWRHVKNSNGLRTYSARRLTEVNYSGEAVAPLMVDFDSDGILDLLVMVRGTGRLDFYKGLSIGSNCVFAAPQVVLTSSVVGGTPVLVDWNDDGKKDLLIGGADGMIALLLNGGSDEAPQFNFANATYLNLAGGPLTVSGNAVPAVIDYDGDHDKDLIVGGVSGEVVLFVNNGTDAAPSFADGQTLSALSNGGAVAPFVTDWNADGSNDLLLASDGMVTVAYGTPTGFAAPVRLLALDLYGRRYYPVGKGLRVFALDVDGNRGKDLVVGDSQGRVQLLGSYGNSMVPAFYTALVDKVDQLGALVTAYGQPVVTQVAELRALVADQQIASAILTTNTLAASLASGSPEAQVLAELQSLLQ